MKLAHAPRRDGKLQLGWRAGAVVDDAYKILGAYFDRGVAVRAVRDALGLA